MADPFLDALGISDPTAKPPAAPGAKKSAPQDPLDAAIRTVLAESSSNPTERRWVAGVIANRAKAGKKSLLDVVAEPGQFEGFSKIGEIDPASDEYKAAAAQVSGILQGKEADPSGGAMHFYAPSAQAQLAQQDGRPTKPSFDDGSGVKVGQTMFFGGKGKAPDEFLSSLGVDPDTAEAAAAKGPEWTGAGLVGFKGIDKATLNKPQQSTYEEFVKGGYIKQDEAEGSVLNPLWMAPGSTDKDVPPGQYFVDAKGKLQRAPGGEKQSSFMSGLSRGGGDVVLSIAHALPGTDDSTIKNRMEADQAAYNATYGGDLKSGMGRFTGQVLTSAPLLAGGEAVLAPALRAAGPVGSFLAGQAGKAALPETAGAMARVGQLATRGTSLATSGAGEGAAASALTSSADEHPVGEQVLTGALLGGALKPVGTAVTGGMSRFFGPNLKGAAAPVDQLNIAEQAKKLAVPVPMSLGQITGAPAQQMLENSLLRGSEGDIAAGVMQAFRGEQQGALRGNVRAIAGNMAQPNLPTSMVDLEAGAGGKAVSDKLNTMRDAVKAKVDGAYQSARAQGENAMLASAKDARDAMMEGLRANYDLTRVKSVADVIEGFGAEGAPTARQLFDMRTKLSNLTQSSDAVEGAAARSSVRALDGYVDKALREDLLIGDPKAVTAWRDAISKRAAMGKLFEGDDLIDALTERVQRGGGSTLKVDPEEATNYILGRSALGFVGKRNLGRDLKRLQGVLGKDSDEWNGLRSEAFMRIARAGEGSPEGGLPQFSGQNFMKAWEKAKKEDPQVLGVLFTPEERQLVDQFAEVAQRVTMPVKGGDNPSNTAITAKRFFEPVMQFLSVGGGAGGGAAIGGVPGAVGGAALGSFMKQLREILSAGKARRFTYGAKPTADKTMTPPLLANPLVPTAAAIAGTSATDTQPKQ